MTRVWCVVGGQKLDMAVRDSERATGDLASSLRHINSGHGAAAFASDHVPVPGAANVNVQPPPGQAHVHGAGGAGGGVGEHK